MNPVALAVPRDAVAVAAFVDNFRAAHNGVTPIGGGETIADALGAPAPPAQTTPSPAAPQAPAQAAPGLAPPPADPNVPAAPPAAQPDWYQGLLDRMDAMGPQTPVDPVLNDLGLGPATPPQQQVQPQPQTPASPGLGQPQQPQPGTPFPGQPMDPAAAQQQQVELVRAWISEEAQSQAKAILEPQLQQMAAQRRQEEMAGLRNDYEEFRDQAKAEAVVSRARAWARQMGREDLVQEPMFLEVVLHAARSVDQAAAAAAQGAPVPVGTQQVPQQPGYPIEQPGAAAPGTPVDPAKAISQRIVAARGSGLQGTVFV